MSAREPGPFILFVGEDPATVDFSDPALPPGLDAAKIRAGIAVAMEEMARRGWHADLSLIPPGPSAASTIERQLAARAYDCVVIGAGIRLPAGRVQLFEQIVNAIRRVAPRTAIAFNTSPADTADAAGRWL